MKRYQKQNLTNLNRLQINIYPNYAAFFNFLHKYYKSAQVLQKSAQVYNFNKICDLMQKQEDPILIHNALSIPQVQQLRIPKVPEQLLKITQEQIIREYMILKQARYRSNAFHKNNGHMNRYTDILVYEKNRVKIPHIDAHYYLNASHITSVIDNKQFAIFAQAPVPPFGNFWQASYWKNIDLILMLCNTKGYQAHQYWPKVNQNLSFTQQKLQITNLKEQKLDEDLNLSTFQMEGPEGKKTLSHYQWTGWEDLKSPQRHTIEILQKFIEIGIKQIENKKPLIIHCSAGIGRTGTLGTLIEAIRWINLKNQLSVFKIVENLRNQRIWCVQTFDQYRFIYTYLKKYITQRMNSKSQTK